MDENQTRSTGSNLLYFTQCGKSNYKPSPIKPQTDHFMGINRPSQVMVGLLLGLPHSYEAWKGMFRIYHPLMGFADLRCPTVSGRACDQLNELN